MGRYIKPRLSVFSASDSDLPELSDGQLGPLAEAKALADVMNIIAVDQLITGEDTLPTLTRMLIERLANVTAIVAK